MDHTVVMKGRTVREVTDDHGLADAVWLFTEYAVSGCRGVDSVRTESILVLYEGGVPAAAGEVRWNLHGLIGLNRMAVAASCDLAVAERALLDFASKRRPPWVPARPSRRLPIAA